MNLLLEMITGDVVYTFIVPGLFLGASLILFSRFVPDTLAQVKTPALLSGILLVLFFTFYSGKYSESSKIKIKEAEYQAELQALKAQSAELSTQAVIKYVDRVKVIEKEKLIYGSTSNWIDQATVNNYPLPNGAIRLLDEAAAGAIPETPNASDGTSSSVKIDQAVGVIAENYTDCRIYAERLSALQEWVRTQESLYNKD